MHFRSIKNPRKDDFLIIGSSLENTCYYKLTLILVWPNFIIIEFSFFFNIYNDNINIFIVILNLILEVTKTLYRGHFKVLCH